MSSLKYDQRPGRTFYYADIWLNSESNLVCLSKVWVQTTPKSVYLRHSLFSNNSASLRQQISLSQAITQNLGTINQTLGGNISASLWQLLSLSEAITAPLEGNSSAWVIASKWLDYCRREAELLLPIGWIIAPNMLHYCPEKLSHCHREAELLPTRGWVITEERFSY